MEFAGLALVLLFAVSVQSALGFGAALLSLSIGSLFCPLSELLPVVVPLALLLSVYIAVRYWRFANSRLLVFELLPRMVLGLGLAQLLAPLIDGPSLRYLLGFVVVLAACRGLLSALTGRVIAASPKSRKARLAMIFAGLVHGLVATGGPGLVYATSAAGLDRRSFRSTLAMVWIVLNGVMVSRFVAIGSLGGDEARSIGTLIPVLVMGTLLGEFLHARVSEHVFRVVVLGLLAIAGVLLCAPMVLG